MSTFIMTITKTEIDENSHQLSQIEWNFVCQNNL